MTCISRTQHRTSTSHQVQLQVQVHKKCTYVQVQVPKYPVSAALHLVISPEVTQYNVLTS